MPADPASSQARGPVALIACPACGHEIGVAAEPVLVCPRCGGSLAAVAAIAEAAESADSAEPHGPAAAPALASHAARGFSFMLLQSLGTRVVAFACQMALAHILLPDAWGTLALADAIAAFATLFQLIGVREILVARQRKFHVWSNAAFWITSASGWATALVIAIAAPIAAYLRDNHDLAGVMLILAISMPLYSMGIVSEAKLQAELRFKRLALIIAVWAMLLPVLTVVFAALGFGVYAFVIPRFVAGAVRLFMVTRAARPRIRRSLQLRRWKYITSTSALIIVTSLLLLIVQSGDRFLLGFFADDRELGLYSFALAFSLQTILVVSVNLQGVLFATLAKLNDEPARQLAAFLRASRVLAMIVTPICVFQAAASEPLVRTLFPYDKWKDAVPAMQWLALGMIFLGSYCPSSAMLEAQRRFKSKFKLALGHAIIFLALVMGLGWLGERGWIPVIHASGGLGAIIGGAIGVALSTAIASPLWSFVTTRPLGGTWADTLAIVGRPLIAAGLAAGVGVLISRLAGSAAAGVAISGIPLEHWMRLVAFCSVAGIAYIILARLLMPAEFREIARKFAAIARRASPKAAVAVERAAGIA